jgi:hypothetical protein
MCVDSTANTGNRSNAATKGLDRLRDCMAIEMDNGERHALDDPVRRRYG